MLREVLWNLSFSFQYWLLYSHYREKPHFHSKVWTDWKTRYQFPFFSPLFFFCLKNVGNARHSFAHFQYKKLNICYRKLKLRTYWIRQAGTVSSICKYTDFGCFSHVPRERILPPWLKDFFLILISSTIFLHVNDIIE